MVFMSFWVRPVDTAGNYSNYTPPVVDNTGGAAPPHDLTRIFFTVDRGTCDPAIAATKCEGETFANSCGQVDACQGTLPAICDPAVEASTCQGVTFANSCGVADACQGMRPTCPNPESVCSGQTYTGCGGGVVHRYRKWNL